MDAMKKVIVWTIVVLVFVATIKYVLFSHATRCTEIAQQVASSLERYGQCEVDSDCTIVTLSCPFDCNTPLHKAQVQAAFSEVTTYQKNCMMVCPDCPPAKATRVSCQNGQCRKLAAF
jgi:hypothetical protein